MTDIPFQATGLVTLITDFGSNEPYVGAMKGAILARHPAARLVDLTHEVPAFQPILAGFWLARIWPHFPAGTVHLAVVDPGVGTPRDMVLLQAVGQVFVAPDNGLLEPVLRSVPDASWQNLQLADLVHLHLPEPSHTFHGRDIFAPLVAEIAANRQPPDALGRRQLKQRQPVLPMTYEPPVAEGHIVWADRYGNLITDIEAGCLERFTRPVLRYRDLQIVLRRSYGFAAPGELLAVVNSWGTLEIAVARGSAQQLLQAGAGEAVWVAEARPADQSTG